QGNPLLKIRASFPVSTVCHRRVATRVGVGHTKGRVGQTACGVVCHCRPARSPSSHPDHPQVSAVSEAIDENINKMNNENNELMTKERQQDKGGRPSKYQPETVDRLLEALADGLTIRQACIAAGIGETTLSRWKDEHPELETQLVDAREHARQKAL